MRIRKKAFLATLFAILTCLAGVALICKLAISPYTGMQRISSYIIQGSTTNGDHNIQLPNLKKGQLVILEADEGRNSWIKHSSTETFVVEGRSFENGRLEYEVLEDADYHFQLVCDHTEFSVSINIWEKVE